MLLNQAPPESANGLTQAIRIAERLRNWPGDEATLLREITKAASFLAGTSVLLLIQQAEKAPSVVFTAPHHLQETPTEPAIDLEHYTAAMRAGECLTRSNAYDSHGPESGRAGHELLIPLTPADPHGAHALLLLIPGNRNNILGRTRATATLILAPILARWRERQLATHSEHQTKALRDAMRVLAALNPIVHFKQAAMVFCNELAAMLGARRVSIGIARAGGIALMAISGTEHIIRKTDDARAIQDAMEECADQGCEVIDPPPPASTTIGRSAQRLARMHETAVVCSSPLIAPERHLPKKRRSADHGSISVAGVLTVEIDSGPGLTMPQLEALRLTWELCGPALIRLHEQDRWIGIKALRGLRRAAAWVVGSTHTWIKLAALAALGLTGFLILAEGTYRVNGSFTVEADTLNVIDAPYEGTLDTVLVQPGDPVRAGQTILASLRTTDLRLELASLRADRHRAFKEADVAGRDSNEAARQIALAGADQADAQIRRLEEDLRRADLRSMVDGVVLSGDLKRRIGGRVDRSEVLFEVAPLDAMRAAIMVPEGQINDVTVGQRGQLAAAADPRRRVSFTVDRIEPLARISSGQNVFAVQARFDQIPSWIRPGMEGVAKIDVDRRRYAWIWTRSTVDWLRMKLWW